MALGIHNYSKDVEVARKKCLVVVNLPIVSVYIMCFCKVTSQLYCHSYSKFGSGPGGRGNLPSHLLRPCICDVQERGT